MEITLQTIDSDMGINVLHLLAHGVLAMLLGVAKTLNALQSLKFSFFDFSRSALISFSIGLLMYFLFAYFSVHILLSCFLVGLVGWIGGNFMDFAGFLFKKTVSAKLGVNYSTEEEKSHSELINK